ncbi:hypothetical protein QEW_2517 [Clostridioides difficile CD160]|nr:hypothetical protein QEW_2517 [Clostridioides difficile CD160]
MNFIVNRALEEVTRINSMVIGESRLKRLEWVRLSYQLEW